MADDRGHHGMNVYVVSSTWYRDGATVIGAATDRAGAEVIADRYDEDDPRIASWTSWTGDAVPVDGRPTWRRDALLADGIVHPSLSQEIVCVPLAGQPDALQQMRSAGEIVASTTSPRG
jgi:hypothetical protein